MERNWDCIIIGGGIAGLTAATFLAKTGKSVLLLEKSRIMGGRGITTEKEGNHLNLGPHALYSEGESIKTLSELGIEIQGGNPNINGGLIHQGQMRVLPTEPIPLLTSQIFSWKGKLELTRFYMNLKKLVQETNENMTFEQWLHQHIMEENAKKFLRMLVRLSTYCHDPHLIQAKSAFQQLQLGKSIYIHGGWQVLVDSLIKQAISAGVVIKKGTSVHQINGESPHFSVDIEGNQPYLAKNIISTASPSETRRMLRAYESSPSLSLLDELVPVRAACLDIVLNHLPNPDHSFVLSMDQPLYFSNHSAVARLGKDGNQVVHVLKYLSANHQQSETEDRRELEDFIDKIQPGWKKHVVYERFLSRMTVTHLPKTGLHSSEDKNQPLYGFYLAGDWVGSEGMLADRSFISAKKAAQAVMGAVQLI